MSKSDQPGCLLAFTKLIGLFRGRAADPPPLPYRRKDWFFSKAERSFYGVLQQATSGRYVVFAKVRLLDLVYLAKGTETAQSHRNRVQSKHVDFVLCDTDAIRPLLVIELDDTSHERADRITRDAFVDAALAAAGLPILRVPARQGYSVDELRRQIGECVAN